MAAVASKIDMLNDILDNLAIGHDQCVYVLEFI